MSNNNENFINRITLKNVMYVFIIMIFCVILCIYDLRWIIPSIIITVILLSYTIWDASKKKVEIISKIEEVSTDMSSASKENLVNSPIPMILVETDGRIVWRSRTFVEEFQNVDMSTYLTQIIKEIKLDLDKSENAENKFISKQFNVDKKIYRIKGSVVKKKRKDKRKKVQEYMLNLYFIDETKYNELFDKYNNSRTCVGMAIIDNYDDIIKTALPEEKIELLANIEKELISWISDNGGLMIKTERDSFVFIFEQQYLKEFEKDKFSILDKVKEIKASNETRITLSLSISNEGNNDYERYRSAIQGMDVVLGRGGDQAIVKKEGHVKFYGGKTLEVEKRTKVKARTLSQTIVKAMNEADNILIMGHLNIDIDALGSALGMYRLAKTIDKEAYIVSEPKGDSLGKFIEILTENNEYKKAIIPEEDAVELITDNTLLIIVDTHRKSYVEFPDLVDKIKNKIIIDHHRKAPDAISDCLISFHEVYASSASELVAEIVQYAPEDVTLNILEAEALYGGIMIDTKNFTFKTGVRTFEAAAYLRKYGVDIIKVKKWFQTDLESYNKIAEIINNVEIIEDNIGIAIYDNNGDKNASLICAKAADELLTISDITASFVMTEVGEKIFISGRSIGDINVQIILEKLGGGGHITLAGAQLENMSMEDAKNELIIRINEYLLEES